MSSGRFEGGSGPATASPDRAMQGSAGAQPRLHGTARPRSGPEPTVPDASGPFLSLPRESGPAWVFPGVGVKPSGFESVLAGQFPREFCEGFARTADASDRDLWPTLADDSFASLGGLDEQFFSFTFAAVLAGLVGERFGPPRLAAGNSFGVYPALYAAGALSWEACLTILTAAWRTMEVAAARQAANLCAVVGLELAELEAILAEANGTKAVAQLYDGVPVPPVLRVNSNNDTCHIFCGPAAGIAGLETAALAAGAINVVVLPLAMPYHHPGFHGGDVADFRDLVAARDWCGPRFPLVSTLDCRLLETPADLIDFVARQAFEPIDWAAVVRQVYAWGVGELFECGPGLSLTQNARFLPGEARWQNCRTLSKRLVTHG